MNRELRAILAFQKNISEQQYEYDKGQEFIDMCDWEDEDNDLINALKEANNTLALCPQTTAVVMTRLLVDETLNKYEV